MLCDTGPLVAIFDADDPYRQICAESMRHLPATPMTTTWACMAEAMHLLGRSYGHSAQEDLWIFIDAGSLRVLTLNEASFARLRTLMTKYSDAPMDFADASLVVAAETLNERQIFTLDQHFRTYLIHDQFPFEVIP